MSVKKLTPAPIGGRRDAGDHHPQHRFERVPVNSARKFVATSSTLISSGDQNLKAKLKREIEIMENCNSKLSTKAKIFKKANSMAEITPTKRQENERLKLEVMAPKNIHASAGRRRRDALDAARVACHRWVVNSWRRNRERLVVLNESSRRHQEQILQLEMQVDVLKNLRRSETEKCEKATAELATVKAARDLLQDNLTKLMDDHKNLRKDSDTIKNNLMMDMGNMKKKIELSTIEIKRLENELGESRRAIDSAEKDKTFLLITTENQENDIKSCQEKIMELNEIVTKRDMEFKLLQDELNATIKQHEEKYNHLSKKRQEVVTSKERLLNELDCLYVIRRDLECLNEDLKCKLEKIEDNYQTVLFENCKIKANLARKSDLWSNAREFAVIVWAIVRHTTYLMLPAIPDF